MGGGNSQEWQGYHHQLMSDKSIRGLLIDGTEEKGTTKILRHPRAKDGCLSYLMDEQKNELDTAWKLFSTSYINRSKNDHCGFRPFVDADNDPSKRGEYQWMTYQETGDIAVAFGCGLRALEIPDKSNIGLFALNRPEWYQAHLGNLSQSYRTTALYDTLGPDAVSYIVKHAEVPVIVTEKSKLKTLFKALSDVKAKCDEEKDAEFSVKYIVQMDYDERYGNTHEKVDEGDQKTAKEDHGVELIGFTELLAKGKEAEEQFKGKNEPKSEDIAYIMYTSGTTGNPKGVVLSHRSFGVSVASGFRAVDPTPNDMHVSYLPLAHIFEAVVQALISLTGAKVGYFQGNIKLISEDWKDLRPTMLVGVPRVFTKTYDKFNLKVKSAGSVKKWLVNNAQNSSTKEVRQGKRSAFYDKYVWSSVCEEIGFDRVRMTLSGAAPLPPHLAEFLRIILPKSSVQQGYGLTECCASATIVAPDNITLGHVGGPTDVIEIRLIDAPECGYLTTDEPLPRGEVQLRGQGMMDGYYKNDEATAKVLNKEGWFSTGDIGRINPNGTLSIIDRRKNLFKTSTGEYIASEKVEGIYSRAGLVGQIWIYGNSFKSFVVAVVVPDAQALVVKLKANNMWTQQDDEIKVATREYAAKFKEVCDANQKAIHGWVMEDLKAQENGLKRFERIKDVHLEFTIDDLLQGFNVDNNLMTPTFKKKRPQLLRHYVDEIKAMYTKNGEPPNENENWVSK